MFTINGGASMADRTSRKRKMKEVAEEQPPVEFASPNRQRVQQILNNAGAGRFKPFDSTVNKPFSYLALLTAPDEELEGLSHSHQIDQIITHHSGNLKHVMAAMLNDYRQATEERAAKKLKQKDDEIQGKLNHTAYLERMVELYKAESERLLTRVRSLERTTNSLRASLESAARSDTELEDSESSSEGPDRVGPVILDCKVCRRQLATVMIWPCRHVCVCKGCESAARVCPVCRSLKTASVEVRLPVN